MAQYVHTETRRVTRRGRLPVLLVTGHFICGAMADRHFQPNGNQRRLGLILHYVANLGPFLKVL
jgi:hypothetical protein